MASALRNRTRNDSAGPAYPELTPERASRPFEFGDVKPDVARNLFSSQGTWDDGAKIRKIEDGQEDVVQLMKEAKETQAGILNKSCKVVTRKYVIFKDDNTVDPTCIAFLRGLVDRQGRKVPVDDVVEQVKTAGEKKDGVIDKRCKVVSSSRYLVFQADDSVDKTCPAFRLGLVDKYGKKVPTSEVDRAVRAAVLTKDGAIDKRYSIVTSLHYVTFKSNGLVDPDCIAYRRGLVNIRGKPEPDRPEYHHLVEPTPTPTAPRPTQVPAPVAAPARKRAVPATVVASSKGEGGKNTKWFWLAIALVVVLFLLLRG